MPVDPGHRPTGNRRSVDGSADGGVIFRATRRGIPVTVARADASELAALAGPMPSAGFRDDLENWNLVAIRGLETGTEIHALGWRVTLANEWITSPLASVVHGPAAVETTSGHAYRLTTPDGARMEPLQRAHLEYALRAWGFVDVKPA